MKLLLLALIIASTSAAYANPNCAALSQNVGSYKLVNSTCDVGPLGADSKSNPFIVVAPYLNNDVGGSYPGYWIIVTSHSTDTAGSGIGPCTSPNDIFQCSKNGDVTTVEDPLGASYSFSGTKLTISYRECVYEYSKM